MNGSDLTTNDHHPLASLRIGHTLHPAISPKRQDEPLPDHPWQLVLWDGYKAERLVEADELQGVEEHVQHFKAAGIDQCLHHEPGKATPAEFFKGEDTVDFMPIRMKPAPRNGGKCPVDKCAKNAVFIGVGPLL